MVSRLSPLEPRSFLAPQRFDAELLDCEVEGTVPAEMDGHFVRVGGEWYYPPKFADDAPLHSDGYISRFRIKDGRVSYQGRFVRTPRFEANLAAGRQQFGYYRNPFTNDAAVRDTNGTVSNTAPLAHGGRLFTLKEDARPIKIDPETLETRGEWDFGGDYVSETFSAHPKIDPLTGEMITYGYEATGLGSDDLFVYFIDRQGRVSREVRLKVPYVSMIHDFAVTQDHLIFPFACYTTSIERLRAGQLHWAWDRQLPSMIGVMRRDGDGSDIRWFKGSERCMMHVFNAFSEGNKVTLHAPFYESNFFPFFPNVDGSPWNPAKAVAYVRKLTFDLDKPGDTWEEEILFPTPIGDLGKIDLRSYIQTGNLFFESDESDRAALRGTIAQHLQASLGYAVPVCLRTIAELEQLLARDPFAGVTVTPETRLAVVFCCEPMAQPVPVPFVTADGGYELIAATDAELFVVWHLKNGRVSNSFGAIEKLVAAPTTTRFWHTTAKILAAAKQA